VKLFERTNHYSLAMKNFLKISIVALLIALSAGTVSRSSAVDNGTLAVTKITAVQTSASVDTTFDSGWKWTLEVTVPINEPIVKLKFGDWTSGSNNFSMANNVRFYSAQADSVVDASHAVLIPSVNTYSEAMNLNTSADLDNDKPGRQIRITVEARIPNNVKGGSYSASYGISSIGLPLGPDTVKPVITLNGNASVSVEAGTDFTDLGATAQDARDGDISSKISVDGHVDTTKLGDYTLTYLVKDAAQNAATPITRTVHVVDTTKPTISVSGPNPLIAHLGDTVNNAMEGVTASDSFEGDLTSQVVLVENPDTSKTGTFTITYSVSDSSGNTKVFERGLQVNE
jgi:hypothetical protein